MGQKRKKHTAEFKAQVVLSLLSEKISMAQICKNYGIKGSMVCGWKSQFLQRACEIFQTRTPRNDEKEQRIAELERMVGKLTMEREILKKASSFLNSL
jgi:transposase-like protein